MAEVFAATSPSGETVAVKRVLSALVVDEEFRAMFWDETCIMGQLEHPNIIRLLDYGKTEDTLFLALEYVDGPSVARFMRKAARDKIAPNLSAAVSIIAQLLAGLGYVHDVKNDAGEPLRIVHRDVSPGNVLLSSNGFAKLGDFGIVRSDFLARRTQPGELKGKIGYMSPEQAQGTPLDHRSDLFSAGIILAELLTLRPLFLGRSEFDTLNRTVQVDLSTWHRFNQAVPLPLRAVVERALHLEPKKRFSSADKMRAALLEAAYAVGLSAEQHHVTQALGDAHMLPEEERASGQRPVGGRAPPRPQKSSSSSASWSISTFPPAQNIGEAKTQKATISAHDQRWIGLQSFRRGRPIWRAEFRSGTLFEPLFAALRRVLSGGVEFTTGGRTLFLELQRGRVVAAHDSTGHKPLGQLLLEESIVSSGELSQAIATSRRLGIRLGEHLLLERRLREGVLNRLLKRQFHLRLADWLTVDEGRVAAFSHENGSGRESESAPDSVAQTVEALREGLSPEAVSLALRPVLGSAIFPSGVPLEVTQLGLTAAEARVLYTVLEGGALEGRPTRQVLEVVVSERLARRREGEFALLMGLSTGLIQAPGFGRRD